MTQRRPPPPSLPSSSTSGGVSFGLCTVVARLSVALGSTPRVFCVLSYEGSCGSTRAEGKTAVLRAPLSSHFTLSSLWLGLGSSSRCRSRQHLSCDASQKTEYQFPACGEDGSVEDEQFEKHLFCSSVPALFGEFRRAVVHLRVEAVCPADICTVNSLAFLSYSCFSSGGVSGGLAVMVCSRDARTSPFTLPYLCALPFVGLFSQYLSLACTAAAASGSVATRGMCCTSFPPGLIVCCPLPGAGCHWACPLACSSAVAPDPEQVTLQNKPPELL